MPRKLIITLLLIIFILTTYRPALGLSVGQPDYSGSNQNLICSTWLAKLICEVKKISDYMKTIREFSKLATLVPHWFPFGGPILASDTACGFRLRAYVYVPNPGCFVGACFPGPTIPVPVPIPIPLGGNAIVVGPPLPTYPDPGTFNFSTGQIPPGGWVITFPWISQIYRNYTEDRAGPWALGLGFSPFPLAQLNSAIDDLIIWIPPKPEPICPNWFVSYPIGTVCITDFNFDCKESGERDAQGNDIYKVILKLGTSPQDAPASAFPPGFPIP